MNKRDLSESEFNDLANAERIAFYTYYYIIKNKMIKEYVDILGNTVCGFINSYEQIPVYYTAMNILREEYKIGMLALPFKDKNFKLEIEKYDLLKRLENYFNDNNIKLNKDIITTAKELKENDSAINFILNRIEIIDKELNNTSYDNISI